MIQDLEQDTLTNEEQALEIRRLKFRVGNLEVQLADYQQIITELNDRLAKLGHTKDIS